MNEQQFLKAYDIAKYDRPSVTADIAIFTIGSQRPDSYRHDPGRRSEHLCCCCRKGRRQL